MTRKNKSALDMVSATIALDNVDLSGSIPSMLRLQDMLHPIGTLSENT